MKIAFFGTSDRTLPILDNLFNSDHVEIGLCVTKADTKVGRKQELRETAVKKWAKVHEIPCFEIQNMKVSSDDLIAELKEREIDLGIVVDFSFIIPKEFFINRTFKLINIHFSLLPKNRGASPVQFSILNRDEKTGITIQEMVSKLDAGDIITQIEYKLGEDVTSEQVYEELFDIAATKIPEIIQDYSEGNLVPVKQDENEVNYTYSKTDPKKTIIFKEDARIDWSKSVEDIYAAIRAFYPWPIAYTTLGELESGLEVKLKGSVNRGLLVKIHKARLDTKKEKLMVVELQVEGKKVMSWNDFKNGYLA